MACMDWYEENNLEVLQQNEEQQVFRIREESGEGRITVYSVFPGCYVCYDDFQMTHCVSAFQPEGELFRIDHCREGRIEWEREPNHFVYVSAGDFQVECRRDRVKEFYLPLKHYRGVSICLEKAAGDQGIFRLMEDFSVDLNRLQEKFCPENRTFMTQAGRQLDRIFSDLYCLPDRARRIYLKIKIMELLLTLTLLELPQGENRPSFCKTQVDKIKHIVELQTADLSQWYTLDQLSTQFSFPLTGMKQCFKGIYGCTMAEYMKKYRMHAAAELLRSTREPVIEIAAQVGYEHPGKFSAAFRSVLGMTPSEFRKTL